jgi:hypothetical protein
MPRPPAVQTLGPTYGADVDLVRVTHRVISVLRVVT